MTNLQKAIAKFAETLSVGGRGFDAIETAVESVPDEMLIRALEYGWQQANADSASSAARDAMPSAVTEGHEGDKAESLAKAWIADDANAPAILAERIAQIKGSIARKIEGEWKVKTASGTAFTALDEALYKVAGEVKGNAGWSDAATVFTGLKGASTRERMETVLAFIESLDETRKAAITNAAQSRIDSLAALSGIES